MKKLILVISALGIGVIIAYVDSRPGWDDTGITAVSLLAASALFGFLSPRRPWFWALAVGIWIPLLGILLHRDLAMLLTLVFSLVGAYLGAGGRLFARKLIPPSP